MQCYLNGLFLKHQDLPVRVSERESRLARFCTCAQLRWRPMIGQLRSMMVAKVNTATDNLTTDARSTCKGTQACCDLHLTGKANAMRTVCWNAITGAGADDRTILLMATLTQELRGPQQRHVPRERAHGHTTPAGIVKAVNLRKHTQHTIQLCHWRAR